MKLYTFTFDQIQLTFIDYLLLFEVTVCTAKKPYKLYLVKVPS